ncbi:electron transfer flavoprotein subunit beta, partial [Candidatus Bathyarchaeota archaeon]
MSEGYNIVVCIKQVPETTEVDFDEETGRLKREGVAAVINPFDE